MEMGAMRRHSSQAGFTLLEIVIALAILGIAFALAMELLAAGVRSVKASEDYIQATMLARHKMALFTAISSLEDAYDGGEYGGGLRWSAAVQAFAEEEADEVPARLQQAWVRVMWPGGRGRERWLDLYTLRMAVDEKKLQRVERVPASSGSRQTGTQ
jgi:general secretion pathway protein I